MSLFGEELVTRTKFIAPAPRRAHLARPRLYALLDELADLPLGVVVAGTGYGKSSLIAGYLAARSLPTLWYELSERDADVQVFAVHLAHVIHRAYPGAADRALALLAMPGGALKHGLSAIEALGDALLDHLEGDSWLVLDDFHVLHGAPATLALINRFIALLPPRLHVVLLSRQRPELPDLPRWRLEGDVLTLDQETLAFRPDEAAALLESAYGLAIDDAHLAQLMAETEGWPMAIQLLGRRLSKGAGLHAPAGTLRDLFDYLAREVLAQLSDDEQGFLLATAPLQRLEPVVCQALSGAADAADRLRALNERGLFLIPLGHGAFRHHHLFREFLLERLAEADRLQSARRAAGAALLAVQEPEEAIAQWLDAGDLEPAAGVMATVAPALVSQGRYARLETWLACLPDSLLDRAPALSVCMGDACRLSARFEEAIAWYERAERSYGGSNEGRCRALAGQALVYLDTVRPAQAETLLERALECAPDVRRRAEILVMRAENKLNQGEAPAALALFDQARSELPEAAENEARIRLRTGRLLEARAILRAAIASREEANTGTKAHREAVLVLSLIESFMGEPASARSLADQGLTRARVQQAAWTEAVALMRRGHAALVGSEAAAAERDYREALTLAGTIGVARLKAEPLMGLALLRARAGALDEADRLGREALEATAETGDAWVQAMLGLTLGVCFAEAGDLRAERWLMQSQGAYERCGDPFGQALVALASARLALTLGDTKALISRVRLLGELVGRYDYGFILTGPTLLGFADREAACAFLTALRDRHVPAAPLAKAMASFGLEDATNPAIADQLRVRVLGSFRVQRGGEELSEKSWGREKARQLFHLLIAYRGQSLPKARIIDTLWPDLEPESADGTFRVALNALNKALEPDRPTGRPARYIVRQGANYGLAGPEDVWVDASEFERLLDAADTLEAAGEDPIDLLRQALELSEGGFLEEFAQYEGWCERERERLADRYSDAAARLARLLAARGDDTGCAHWAQRLIARDRCAEEAYRLLMIAQYRQGDRTLALRTYDRCVVALSDELDVDPMPETQTLFQRITNLEPVSP